MLTWLSRTDFDFPPLDKALQEPNGLLAAGGDLNPQRLVAAYRHGCFPWYQDGQPILWWSPDPRTVLFPDELHVSAAWPSACASNASKSLSTMTSRR